MADPFLVAHCVYPITFDISGRLTPISIRDQMVRARMIVDHAVRAGLLRSGPTRGLVIAGAGAAGVTAALRAAEHHRVQTLLIDSAPMPFSRQAGCLTRWVDPTQYDWPLDHWHEARYPWNAPTIPLPWNANAANAIALRWTAQFRRAYRRCGGRLHYFRLTRVTGVTALPGLPGRPSGVRVDFTSTAMASLAGSIDADMLLTCLGFGAETCTVGAYRGYQFWDTDPYGSPSPGVESHLRVLISGGGDGSLQDFLRIATGQKSAADILRALAPPPGATWQATWDLALRVIQSAEDQANRAYAWSDSLADDHWTQQTLHAAHRGAIRELWKDSDARLHLSHHLRKLTEAAPHITLVHRCTHFGKCYALNHFIVRLLNWYDGSKFEIRPDNEVTDVRGVGHTCGNAAMCHGRDHEVDITPADCLGSAGASSTLGTYQVVVVRHGILPSTISKRLLPVLLPRQLLPYHVPV